jgi:hypothetical protein
MTKIMQICLQTKRRGRGVKEERRENIRRLVRRTSRTGSENEHDGLGCHFGLDGLLDSLIFYDLEG